MTMKETCHRGRIVALALLALLFLPGCGTLTGRKARTAVAALNRGDIAAYLQDWDEDAVFVYPGDTSASGEIKGKAAIAAWFANWRRTFPDLQFTIQDVYLKRNFYLGWSNVIAVHWRAAGTNRFGQKVESSGIGVVNVEGTKIVRLQDYIFAGHRLKEFWGETAAVE